MVMVRKIFNIPVLDQTFRLYEIHTILVIIKKKHMLKYFSASNMPPPTQPRP